MLYITFGTPDAAIVNTKTYFKNSFEKEWLEDDVVKKMIKDIDNSEVISGQSISSPVLGIIPPEDLSGGVKTLILMMKEDKMFDASNCGNNCAQWIIEIAKRKDLHIALGYIMKFADPYDNFEAIIENDGSKVSTMKEYVYKAIQLLQGGDN